MVSIPTNIAEINVFVELLRYLEYSKKIRKLLAITKFEWCNKKRCISGASVSRKTQRCHWVAHRLPFYNGYIVSKTESQTYTRKGPLSAKGLSVYQQ
ncbi:hypothetical protein T4B_4166 [Trichinella pseudospiralis]|uniref:Uncharacterized protein n=1 Tax=Trichinella pseudospiralis TaxID=6337 RepID=A0A0V1GML7_TRIPS|nr:hypothetical protein T4B_4166 [Trichinella pseudospiralis]